MLCSEPHLIRGFPSHPGVLDSCAAAALIVPERTAISFNNGYLSY